MDDMNAFERQVAGEFVRRAGPVRPVNAAAIFTTITTTQSPKWRFQPMFSATKFVVAGAIVALFGGFLLAGVLTQPSEDVAPAAEASVSVDASRPPEPTLDVLALEWVPLELDEATFGLGARLVAVAASDSMVVVGGSVDGSAAVWTSTDRVTWDRVPHDEAVFGGPADQEIKAIVPWREGFVAAGEVGGVRDSDPLRVAVVWLSDDGTTWTRVPHDEAVFGGKGRQQVYDIAATEDQLAIVGFDEEGPAAGGSDDIAVWTSEDAVAWAQQAFGGGEMLAIAGNPEGFVGVGHRGLWGSSDGLQWERTDPGSLRLAVLLGLASTPSGFVAVGEHDGPAAWTSPDGATWTRASIDDAIPDGDVCCVNAVASADSGLAAVVGPGDSGGDSAILVSSDGETWAQGIVPDGVADAGLRGIAAIGSHFVAIGDTGSPIAAPSMPNVWTTFEPPTVEVSTQADDNTTLDLLPDVDLVTEEVEPGVYRVLGDGQRDLSKPVVFNQGGGVAPHRVVTAPDGSVWVFGPEEFFRLGDEDAQADTGTYWGDVIDVDRDGHVWALGGSLVVDVFDGCRGTGPPHLVMFDGNAWTAKLCNVLDFQLHPDGSPWVVVELSDERGITMSVVGRVRDGEWEKVRDGQLDVWEATPLLEGFGGFAMRPPTETDDPDLDKGWLVNGAGELELITLSPDGGGAAGRSAEGDVVALGFGSDHTSWAVLRFEEASATDGSLTTEEKHLLARFPPMRAGEPY